MIPRRWSNFFIGRREPIEEMLFVAADDILLKAVKTIGAKAINPLSGPEIIMP